MYVNKYLYTYSCLCASCWQHQKLAEKYFNGTNVKAAKNGKTQAETTKISHIINLLTTTTTTVDVVMYIQAYMYECSCG